MKRPEIWDRIRRKLADIEPLSPHNAQERKLWTFVAITAGCCEEVLFRGFLLALFTSLAGLVAAVAITVSLFGLFHSYYGWKGILKTAAFGLFVTAIALWSASLVPVIILHASVDLMTGDLAYKIISKSSIATAPDGELLR
jgi:membrane protease YdiL (CAAX protease family)